MVLHIYTDGGSLHNPGPAASAYVVYKEDGSLVAEWSKKIGTASNNVAEYTAVLFALRGVQDILKKERVEKALFFADSNLVVSQINGLFKVKHKKMKEFYDQIMRIKQQLPFPTLHIYIPREKNTRADSLVKRVLGVSSLVF